MINSFQDTFKELNLTQLEIFAEKWAVKFSIDFKRIILFKELNPNQALHEDAMQASIPGRYLVLLELKESESSAFNKMIQATAEETDVLSEDLSERTIFEIWKHIHERYNRLLRATGQYETILDPNINTVLKLLRSDDFHRVYKNKSDYIQDDWKFRVKDPDDKDLPLGVKEEDGYFWVLYDSNKKDLPTDDIQKEATEERQKVFPCKPGSKWEDVKITLTANDKVRIETPHSKGHFTYHELRMSDKRSGDKPGKLWKLLVIFAKKYGAVSFEDIKKEKDRKSLFSTAKRLNKHLQKLFGIEGSIYTGHYKKLKKIGLDPEIYMAKDEQTAIRSPRVKGYKTKIFFSDKTREVQPAADMETDDDSLLSIIEDEIEEKGSRPSKGTDNVYR